MSKWEWLEAYPLDDGSWALFWLVFAGNVRFVTDSRDDAFVAAGCIDFAGFIGDAVI